MKRIIFSVFLCLILSSGLVNCSKSTSVEKKDEVLELRFSHCTADGSAWDIGAKQFADLLNEKSNGKIKVKVYPYAQLAQKNQKTELEQMQVGEIDFTWESPIILGLYLDPRFDVFSLPFFFENYETARKVCDSKAGDKALEWLDAKGVYGLAYGHNGFRQLTNSKHPVTDPSDLSGVKFRVAGSQIFIDIFSALGAQAIKMNFGEVYIALQEKTIDGQENPLSVIDTSKLYSVQDYLSVWNYVYDPIILCISKEKMDSFSDEYQQMIRECAVEAADYQRQELEKSERTLLEKLKKEGMQVAILNGKELIPFKEKTKDIYQKYSNKIGKDIVKLFEDARK